MLLHYHLFFGMQHLLYILKYVRWSPPNEDWIKLNIEGCSKRITSMVGASDLVHDSQGKWLFEFTYNIGLCEAIKRELWVVIQDLMLAWCKKDRKVVLEVDYKLMVRWL